MRRLSPFLRNFGAGIAALLLAGPAAWAQADITWPVIQYDPAAEAEPASPADLILPMPCGGAMAFQRVDVPVERDNPLSDRPLRIGQADEATAFSDYLRPEFLRGPFGDWREGQSHYYIARYEITEGQTRALRGDCAAITPADRRAQGELSWFDAVELGRLYSEWLRANAPDLLPRSDQALGFVRLPTEVEWEYAVRGGVRIDASEFPSRVFSGDADLREFGAFAAPGSSRGRLIPVGLRRPNPLGLFDVYGNAEEMMLEPFRLNAVGRVHGQAGGLVTRGGSYLSTPEQINSAARSELAMFSDRTGEALAAPTFGARFVISAVVTQSDGYLTELSRAWTETAAAAPDAVDDPNAQLEQLIEGEIDPRRRAALESLRLDLLRTQDAVDAALLEAAKSTLLSGAIFVSTLEEDAAEISRLEFNIGNLTDLARVSDTETRNSLNRRIAIFVDQITQLRAAQRGLLLTYRSALETMIDDFSEAERTRALELLRAELLAGGRDEVLRLLLRFDADLESYSARPDMREAEVLTLAITP